MSQQKQPTRLTRSLGLALLVSLSLGLASTSALAQQAGEEPTAAQPPSEGAQASEAPAQNDLLAEILAPKPGGETADAVAKRARAQSPSVKAQQAEIRASAAKVDQAMAAFLPQLTLKASYTRISPLDMSLGGGAIVGAANPGLLSVGPCPGGAPGQCVLDSGGMPAAAASFNITPQLNNYSLSATLAVPISDYILRLPTSRAAVKAQLEASQASKVSQERKAVADAQLAYYNWVRGVAQVAVAEHSRARLERLEKDTQAQLAQGLITRSDALRIKALVASGEVSIIQAQAFVRLMEKNLALLTGDEEPNYTIGEDVTRPPAPLPRSDNLEALVKEGLRKRPEVKALSKGKVALRKSASTVRAGKLPRLDGFADYTYANPGRNSMMGGGGWEGSWSVGAQLTWTLNDLPNAEASATELEANLERLNADEALLRQGIEQEITSAFLDRKQAQASREAAEESEKAAREALTTTTEQFRMGEATTTDVINAEQELVNSTLQRMSSYIDLHVSQIRLKYAIGR